MSRSLTADELLAGASAAYAVEVPAALLQPEAGEATGVAGEVTLRPLAVRDIQRIAQAAKEQRALASVLMIQQALVKPKLTIEQVSEMPAGLAQFLLGKINSLSGLSLGEGELERAVKMPLARACFVLAREFGWTPAQCSDLTVGQVLLYLEMLARGEKEPARP
jgi:hypothetical protein